MTKRLGIRLLLAGGVLFSNQAGAVDRKWTLGAKVV
jgi:hypothetical protein